MARMMKMRSWKKKDSEYAYVANDPQYMMMKEEVMMKDLKMEKATKTSERDKKKKLGDAGRQVTRMR